MNWYPSRLWSTRLGTPSRKDKKKGNKEELKSKKMSNPTNSKRKDQEGPAMAVVEQAILLENAQTPTRSL